MVYSILILFSLAILAGVYFLFLRFHALIETNRELQHALAQAHKVISDEKAAHQQQMGVLQKQVRSNEDLLTAERKRIAADLHDDTIQRMVVVRFRLEQLLYYPIPKRAEAEVQSLHKELEHIMADIPPKIRIRNIYRIGKRYG
jgi:signal transduction histidine kinase